MTCIAAITEHGTIHMAGDTSINQGWTQHTSKQSKVFINNGFALGVSGTLRALQLLRYDFTPPEFHAQECSLEAYMNTLFIDELRDCFKNTGHAKKSDEQEKHENVILIGHAGRLFTISGDYSVMETTENYFAIGNGEEYATGSLFTTEQLTSLLPQERLKIALQCADRYLGSVKAPFDFISLPATPEGLLTENAPISV